MKYFAKFKAIDSTASYSPIGAWYFSARLLPKIFAMASNCFFVMVLLWFVLWLESRDFLARPVVTLFRAVQPLQFTLESVFRTLHPDRVIVILCERKVESFDALFGAPACGVSVSVHVYKSIRKTQKVKRLFFRIQRFLAGFRQHKNANVADGEVNKRSEV